ncbi:MAG: hypothetical protein RR336_00200 [Oscillospiraceae bacterium]
MSKTIELCKVRQGEVFTLDGAEFVKLDDDQGVVFALTRDVALKNIPFEDGDADRDDHNNFSGSNLWKVMERWARDKHQAIYDALVERSIDLTTMDGMTDYGCPVVLIRALTIDEYRKYRKFIPLTSEAYWLATGYSTNSSPSSNASLAYYVYTVGTLYYDRVYSAYFAARPALYLKSSILVSVDDGEEETGITGFTDTELMDELYRRRRATYDQD